MPRRSRTSAKFDPVTVEADTDAPPLHSIWHLTVTRRRGRVFRKEFVSSAALIGDRHLLTAAHNVYSTGFSSVLSANTVSEVDTEREFRLTHAFSPDHVQIAEEYGWFDFDRDYAVVRLAAASPRPTQFRLPRAGENLVERGVTVHVAGFPAARRFQSGKLYSGSGSVTDRTDRTFRYAVDTGKGMSGCPVWIERTGEAGPEYLLVGVHVGFDRGGAVARRVDEATLLDDIDRWTGNASS